MEITTRLGPARGLAPSTGSVSDRLPPAPNKSLSVGNKATQDWTARLWGLQPVWKSTGLRVEAGRKEFGWGWSLKVVTDASPDT